MTDQQAAALIAAGRILQSRQWSAGPIKIAPAPGETYPLAVARVIAALDAGERDRLRGLVAWVLEYERAEAAI
jgi:hypothetical protein